MGFCLMNVDDVHGDLSELSSFNLVHARFPVKISLVTRLFRLEAGACRHPTAPAYHIDFGPL
jgi:hypothetical protein